MTEIEYITNRPCLATDVTVIIHVNMGSDHRIVMSNTKLDKVMETKKLKTKRPPIVDITQIG